MEWISVDNPTLIPGTVSRRGLLATTLTATMVGSVVLAGRAAAVPSGPFRIDMHAHILPPDYRASLLSHGYLTIGGYPTPNWSPSAALEFMARYDIQTQVLSVSDPGVMFLPADQAKKMARYCNTYMADLVKQYPDRFGALAVIPMHDLGSALEEIAYALDVLKMDG